MRTRPARLGAVAAAILLAEGCGSSARVPAASTRAPAPAALGTPTTTLSAGAPARTTAKRRLHVAPLPPPVPDPPPADAATGVSPGAPSDAQVRRELKRALGLKGGATNHTLLDVAEVTPDGLATTPPTAPDAVDAVIRAGNRVSHAPYVYGGGHGTWFDTAYDCSGSVSFALANAGLVQRQLDSTSFEHWGRPGPGRWITVYANGGHAWMTVAGLRFDTSGRSRPRGSRWQAAMRGTSGFVARHPAGL